MLRCFAFAVAFSTLFSPLFGQRFEPRFRRLTVDDAPIMGNMEIFQDREGYMWIGSRTGLYRYDGNKIRVYSDAELSSRYFQSGFVNLVFESADGRLWATTDAGALLVYRRELDRFQIVNDSLTSLKTTAYAQLSDQKGNFWIATLGAGLFYYNTHDGSVKNLVNKEGDAHSLPANVVLDIVVGADGNRWVATTNGLCKLNPDDSTFTRVPLSNVDPGDTYKYRVLRDLHAASDGKLYITSYRGLHILDYATLNDQHLLHVPGNASSLSHNSLFRIAEDASGMLWLASYGGGLNRYDPSTGRFSSWQWDTTDPYSVASNNIFEVFIDRQQQLWIGTADEGVCLMKTEKPQIQSLRHLPGNPASLPRGLIRRLWVENDSVIWLGYNGDGLVRLNYLTGNLRKFSNDPNDPGSIGHNSISGIAGDDNGNIWVGLEGGGLNKLDQATGKFRRFTYQRGKNSIFNEAVSHIHYSKQDNRIWITEYTDGIDIYDIATDKFIHPDSKMIEATTGVSTRNLSVIREIGNELWFFGDDGLIVYDRADSSYHGLNKKNNQPRNAWVEMNVLHASILSLSTHNELVDIRLSDRQVVTTVMRQLNTTDKVTSIATAGEAVWALTSKNLIKYVPATGEYTQFDHSDPTLSNRFVYYMASYGDVVFFSTEEGLCWFREGDLRVSTYSPPVVLTNFSVFNSPVAVGGNDSTGTNFTIPAHISATESIDLSHRESFFSFEFTAMEYYSPERIEYAYQLKGFDKNWITTGNRKYASYTNLDPGSYEFLVKATNGHGEWTYAKPIKVIIHPPFWKTTWFMALEVIVVAAIAYAFHRYQVAQSVKIERLRNKIASDLHDEVGSSLTRIALYSDMLDQGNTKPDQKKYLHGIRRLSTEVISTMSDIVWSVDVRSDTLGDLILRMKDFANEVLAPRNVEVVFDVAHIDEKRVLGPALKQNLYLVFKESINNIVKHADATKVLIAISNQQRFRMEIHDNGKGFGADENHKGHGLRNMNRRAANINAKLDISSHGKGTLIQLQRETL